MEVMVEKEAKELEEPVAQTALVAYSLLNQSPLNLQGKDYLAEQAAMVGTEEMVLFLFRKHVTLLLILVMLP
jgi:hypothetical protein